MKEQIIEVRDYVTKSNLPASDFVINPYVGCPHGCKYCYANDSEESVVKNRGKYAPESAILCSVLDENDKITERKAKSLKERQLSIFDL